MDGKITHTYYFLHSNNKGIKIPKLTIVQKQNGSESNRIQSGFRDLAIWSKISGFPFPSGFRDAAIFFQTEQTVNRKKSGFRTTQHFGPKNISIMST